MSRTLLIKYAYDNESICGVYINSYYELEEKIKDQEEWYNKCKEKLRQLASCTPKDMFPENNDGDTLTLLNREFDDTIESMEETHNYLDTLYRIKHLVDSHSYDENGNRRQKDIYFSNGREVNEYLASVRKAFPGI